MHPTRRDRILRWEAPQRRRQSYGFYAAMVHDYARTGTLAKVVKLEYRQNKRAGDLFVVISTIFYYYYARKTLMFATYHSGGIGF
eukprot:scaffold2614_cov132-Amphora_coffeaeformis.AAC.3